MAFCNQCGTELAHDARFCSACGAPAPGATASETSGMTPPPHAPHGYAPSGFAAPPSTPPSAPIVAPSRGGGMVLPILVVFALLVIGYLLLTGRDTDRAAGNEQTAVSNTPSAGGVATEAEAEAPRRAVDDASDAAAVASANTQAGTTTSAAALDSAFSSNPAAAAVRYAGPVRVSGVIASMVQAGRTPALSMEGRTRFNYMIVNFPEGYRERLAPLSKGQFISVACDEARSLGGTTILSGCLLS